MLLGTAIFSIFIICLLIVSEGARWIIGGIAAIVLALAIWLAWAMNEDHKRMEAYYQQQEAKQ